MNINKQDRNLIIGVVALIAFVCFMRGNKSESYCNGKCNA